MIKRKRRSLFKNDFFGIKEKMFMWRISNSIKKRNHLFARSIECLLNASICIGIPRTEYEAVKLKWIYDKYKSLNSEIENGMKRIYDKICYYGKEN